MPEAAQRSIHYRRRWSGALHPKMSNLAVFRVTGPGWASRFAQLNLGPDLEGNAFGEHRKLRLDVRVRWLVLSDKPGTPLGLQ